MIPESKQTGREGDLHRLGIYFKTDVYEALKEIARLDDRSLSKVINRICRTHPDVKRTMKKLADDQAEIQRKAA